MFSSLKSWFDRTEKNLFYHRLVKIWRVLFRLLDFYVKAWINENCHIISCWMIYKWKLFLGKIYLTNRFHVTVRLFSNRSQMTSKCGKNKKSGTRGAAECVTDVLTTFWRPLWSVTEQTHGNMESICFI